MAGGQDYQAVTTDAAVPTSTNRPSVQRDRCMEVLVNIALLCNGLNIGLNVGLLGPSLPDLGMLTNSSTTEMSVVFIFSSIAYMLGSFMCGVILGRFEGYLLISFTLILQALTTAAAPWSSNLTIVTTFISLSYFFSTVIIAGTAYLCFRLERTRARIMSQSAFLLFNLGKAIVPLLMAPFLAPNPDTLYYMPPTITPKPNLPWFLLPRTPPWKTRKNILFTRAKEVEYSDETSSINNGTGSVSKANDLFHLGSHGRESNIGYVYLIIAAFSLFMSILYMIVAAKQGCHLWASKEEKASKDPVDGSTLNISSTTSKARKAAILLAFFFMIFLQCGMESVDAGLMMTFLTEYLHRSKDLGLLANAVYQGVKVIACIAVVLTVKYIHPACLLIIDFLFMLVSTVLMAVCLYFEVGDALLWTTFVLLAIGMSNSYATLASWLETRYSITGGVTTILTISFGLGSMIMPTLTTTLLDMEGPIMFPLVLLGCTILCLLTYAVTKVLMRETCCPQADLTDPEVLQTTVYSTSSEKQPLLEGTTGGAATYRDPPQAPVMPGRVPRILKRQSLCELGPDQCFHAYHSRYINQPTAPSEYTIMYGSGSS